MGGSLRVLVMKPIHCGGTFRGENSRGFLSQIATRTHKSYKTGIRVAFYFMPWKWFSVARVNTIPASRELGLQHCKVVCVCVHIANKTNCSTGETLPNICICSPRARRRRESRFLQEASRRRLVTSQQVGNVCRTLNLIVSVSRNSV